MSLVKKSISLHGHRTSIALEPEFWEGLDEITKNERRPMAATIAKIDDERDPDQGLSSCLRVAVLKYYRNKKDA